jgi:hypothetical protein
MPNLITASPFVHPPAPSPQGQVKASVAGLGAKFIDYIGSVGEVTYIRPEAK